MPHYKPLITLITLISLISQTTPAQAATTLAQKLSGRFLLQVEDRGRCWYVNPADQRRYSLGSPSEALEAMRRLGIGISDANLDKIKTDSAFARQHAGKIFLQVENKGAAWYLNPADLKTYSLGSPILAFEAMRRLSLGISNANLSQIPLYLSNTPYTPYLPETPLTDTMSRAADAISRKNKEETKKYFIQSMHPALDYSLDHMSNDSLLLLAGILRGSKLESSSETDRTYTNEVYFNGTKKKLFFRVKKQSDGSWKITNL